MSSGHYLGVDLGSTTAKAVVVDDRGDLRARAVVQMGAVSRSAMQRAVDQALSAAGLTDGDIAGTIATGYGRRLVPGTIRTYTEITCHARGVAAMCPGTRLVIDIGGQDSKAIAIDGSGLVDEFAMNDRCASGTGRFYEVLARALECTLSELGPLALGGSRDLEVSSMCATFAETEIISLVAQDCAAADIAASVHRAIAARTLALVAQVGRRLPAVLTGGVARNPAAVAFLAEALDAPLTVPAEPQITGAYGAALLAWETADRTATTPAPPADVTFPPDAHAHADGRTCAGCDGVLPNPAPVALGRHIPVRTG